MSKLLRYRLYILFWRIQKKCLKPTVFVWAKTYLQSKQNFYMFVQNRGKLLGPQDGSISIYIMRSKQLRSCIFKSAYLSLWYMWHLCAAMMSWVGCLLTDSGLPDPWSWENGNNRKFEHIIATCFLISIIQKLYVCM